ncbi:MAG: hypothetical protein ACRCX1_04960 [Bacteroidales bacterium]
MASVRLLKKQIQGISDELLSEALFCMYFLPNVDNQKGEELVEKVVEMQREYLQRVGKCGGKEPKLIKSYYRQLGVDFNKAVLSILEEIKGLEK